MILNPLFISLSLSLFLLFPLLLPRPCFAPVLLRPASLPPLLGWAMWTPESLDPCAISGSGSVFGIIASDTSHARATHLQTKTTTAELAQSYRKWVY